QANDATGTFGPSSAMMTVCVPEVTVPRFPTGVTAIVADDTLVFIAGAVNRTVAVPLESVVTSLALSVPVVALSNMRCPTTGLSWSLRTTTLTVDVDWPSRGSVSGDADGVIDMAKPDGPLIDGASCLETPHDATSAARPATRPVRTML